MALTCICNVYDCMEAFLDRYEDVFELNTSRQAEYFRQRLLKMVTLVNLIKSGDGCAETITGYCTELAELLNYSA